MAPTLTFPEWCDEVDRVLVAQASQYRVEDFKEEHLSWHFNMGTTPEAFVKHEGKTPNKPEPGSFPTALVACGCIPHWLSGV